MIIADVVVTDVRIVAEGTRTLTFVSPEIALSTLPGQFVNIRVHAGSDPLLRRPFSVSRVDGNHVEILFNIVGAGTDILAKKKPGDMINVLGPLGVPYGIKGEFKNALLVAGGLGVAPMAILTEHLKALGKHVDTFLGARSALHLIVDHLENIHVATDDGSKGFHGNAVRLIQEYLKEHPIKEVKIFACGPTRMLKALSAFAISAGLECEISLEGEMACGIGICQGCPVERVGGQKKYALVCTEGPAFHCQDIILQDS
ncbi:MAG: dihydroorotate dehydrogenase electron transfer subunit [Bacteroidota bacterium]